MKSDATKQALANALKQLLQKKQITKITINDITEACGISRMTFYYHFKDIYDLADWTLQEALHAAIAENRTHDNWQQGFLNLLEALKAHQSLILNAYRAIDRELVERYMRREVEALLLPVVEEQAAGIKISEKWEAQGVAVFVRLCLHGRCDGMDPAEYGGVPPGGSRHDSGYDPWRFPKFFGKYEPVRSEKSIIIFFHQTGGLVQNLSKAACLCMVFPIKDR